MKDLYRALTCFSLLGLSAVSFADTVEAGRELEDNDIRALKEWIDTKRQVSLKEIGGNLSLSGEVRTEFQSSWEESDGSSLRGRGDDLLPSRAYDVEFNLLLDYRTERTWASIKLEFDDDAGIFNGTLNKIALERAYWGVRLVEGDTYTFDIETGRRAMLTVFDSRVQFGSFFDGILFRYDHSFEKVGDFYIHAGPFVINERKDHYGYIGETGLLNIAGTGIYSKFSLIAWNTKQYSEDFITDRFRFLNTQLTAGYRFRIESIRKIALFYSAFLWNFAAERLPVSDNKRANWAVYAGYSMGQLLKQWDWAFDVNYQIVAAQALPDFDCSGISIGNADSSGFYTKKITPIGGEGASTPPTAAGATNYHGFQLRFDLLLTNKIDMQHVYIQSWTLDSDIGPRRSFIQYELEFIYTW
ncbi:MAG: hypothetical protein K1000chlam2_01094 [Chlamydiae bacterium]|nr:hypothetical protein [Chlamydiota bacterium]